MASQGTTLTQSGQQVQELLNKIDNLAPATQEQAGTMSAEDKAKLDGVAAGADVSVNPDWEASGGKAEILHKPTIPTRIAQLDDDGLHRTVTDDEKANWNSKTSFSGNYNDLTNKPDLSQFITKTVNDLVYYYTKSETYTKTQVDNLINAIQTMHYEVYPILPETGAGNVLYLIGPIGTGADKYEEYVYYNNQWKKIGETSIDLSGYVTTTALNTALANYTTTANLTTLLAGKQDVISDLATIRTGASKGNTAYQKPSGGIPKSDLASGVQDSLDLADSSLQYTPSGVVNPSVTPAEYATRDELEELELEVHNLSGKYYGIFEDAESLPEGDAVGYAFVGTEAPFSIYQFDGTDWEDSGATVDSIQGEPGADGVGFESVASPTPADGTVTITLSNGDTITLDLNHNHDSYYSKVVGTAQPSGGFLPDVAYNLGTVTGTVTFALAASVNGQLNHYFWMFSTGGTAPTITWPTVTWAAGSAPTVAANKKYEISILNGVAYYSEM